MGNRQVFRSNRIELTLSVWGFEDVNLKKSIILVGMMGCGKSSVAKELSKRLQCDAVDTDREIEKRAGISIPDIFEFAGEEGFRRRETETLRDVLKREGVVIATGGGIVTRPENRELIRAAGCHVIYLKVSPKVAYERTRYSDRPLLKTENPLQKLEALIEERSPFYESVCTVVVDGDSKRTDDVAAEIVEYLTNTEE